MRWVWSWLLLADPQDLARLDQVGVGADDASVAAIDLVPAVGDLAVGGGVMGLRRVEAPLGQRPQRVSGAYDDLPCGGSGRPLRAVREREAGEEIGVGS